ncbi:MAG: SHOCT domain-containing protein [Acutalibacteraceae bacterium]|nr:SHOCT domain-containing protein [Acutalibacteraceae bacterium]
MLSKKEFMNEKLYQTTMFIARKMLKEDIITENEYHQIDTMFTEKYSPIFGTLFSDILLTSEPK